MSHSFIDHSGSFSQQTSVSTSTKNSFNIWITYQIEFFDSLHCNADIPLPKRTPDQTLTPKITTEETPINTYEETLMNTPEETLMNTLEKTPISTPEETPLNNNSSINLFWLVLVTLLIIIQIISIIY